MSLYNKILVETNGEPPETPKQRRLRKQLEDMIKNDPNSPEVLKSKAQVNSEFKKKKLEIYTQDIKNRESESARKAAKDRYQQERTRQNIENAKKKSEFERRKRRSLEITDPLKDIHTSTISSKDPDTTAYAKALGNVGSAVGAVTKVGAVAVKQHLEKKHRDKLNAAHRKALEKHNEMQFSMKQKRLPPSRSLGQLARTNRDVRNREIGLRGGTTSEQYSHWREEFLYELGELRQKRKGKVDKVVDEVIVDIMPKGKRNKITWGPKVTEQYQIDEMGSLLATLGNIASAQLSKEKDKTGLLKSAISKMINGKKRKNYLLNYEYIG